MTGIPNVMEPDKKDTERILCNGVERKCCRLAPAAAAGTAIPLAILPRSAGNGRNGGASLEPAK